MSYHDQLHPWVVYHVLPSCQNLPIARFRRRNDASMYLATLQRQLPTAQFLIAFDPPLTLSTRPIAKQELQN